MKQKIHQVNAGENEQRIEIYKCIQNQRLTEIYKELTFSHFFGKMGPAVVSMW